MAELFIEDHNPVSGRIVILEDNGSSAWLYLTPKSGEGIEKDALAYSPIAPMDELNKSEISNGGPPLLTKNVASSNSVIIGAEKTDFHFKWSENGESVAVLYKGTAIAMILENKKYGFSKSISKAGGFGNPWDTELYDNEF